MANSHLPLDLFLDGNYVVHNLIVIVRADECIGLNAYNIVI
jgi:hypothetical protein